MVPSPFAYEIAGSTENAGRQTVSKFRTVTLGNVGMQSRG